MLHAKHLQFNTPNRKGGSLAWPPRAFIRYGTLPFPKHIFRVSLPEPIIMGGATSRSRGQDTGRADRSMCHTRVMNEV